MLKGFLAIACIAVIILLIVYPMNDKSTNGDTEKYAALDDTKIDFRARNSCIHIRGWRYQCPEKNAAKVDYTKTESEDVCKTRRFKQWLQLFYDSQASRYLTSQAAYYELIKTIKESVRDKQQLKFVAKFENCTITTELKREYGKDFIQGYKDTMNRIILSGQGQYFAKSCGSISGTEMYKNMGNILKNKKAWDDIGMWKNIFGLNSQKDRIEGNPGEKMFALICHLKKQSPRYLNGVLEFNEDLGYHGETRDSSTPYERLFLRILMEVALKGAGYEHHPRRRQWRTFASYLCDRKSYQMSPVDWLISTGKGKPLPREKFCYIQTNGRYRR